MEKMTQAGINQKHQETRTKYLGDTAETVLLQKESDARLEDVMKIDAYTEDEFRTIISRGVNIAPEDVDSLIDINKKGDGYYLRTTEGNYDANPGSTGVTKFVGGTHKELSPEEEVDFYRRYPLEQLVVAYSEAKSRFISLVTSKKIDPGFSFSKRNKVASAEHEKRSGQFIERSFRKIERGAYVVPSGEHWTVQSAERGIFELSSGSYLTILGDAERCVIAQHKDSRLEILGKSIGTVIDHE